MKNAGETVEKVYSTCVYTGWDMSVTDEQSVESLKNKITDDIKVPS